MFNKCFFLSLSMQLLKDTFVMSIEEKNESMYLTPHEKRNHSFAARLLRGVLTGFIVLSTIVASHAQYWEITDYGGLNEDYGEAILQTKDHGFLLVGWSESFGANGNPSDGDEDVYVIKTDVDGDVIWERAYDPGFEEFAYDVVETSDGHFVIAGYAKSTPQDEFDIYLLKIDIRGEIIWESFLGTDEVEQANALWAAEDGGLVIAGRRSDPAGLDEDILITKVDADGNEEWTYVSGYEGRDGAESIIETQDFFVATGYRENEINDESDFFLLKLEKNGNFSSLTTHGELEDFEYAHDLVRTNANDGFVLAGFRQPGSGGDIEAFLMRIDDDGNTVQTGFFDNDNADKALAIVQADGGYAISGYSEISSIEVDLLFALFNESLVLQASNLINTNFNNFGTDLTKRFDDGFAIVGYNAELLGFFNNVTLVRTSNAGVTYNNLIEGRVVFDEDLNCVVSPLDSPLEDWIVEVTDENEGRKFYGSTDADGRFSITVDSGNFTLRLTEKNKNWDIAFCDDPIITTTFSGEYDTLVYNFPIQPRTDCFIPYLKTDVSTPVVLNCSEQTYTISYRNDGPATATDVQITLALDEDLTFDGASIIPTPIVADSLYTFEVSDLPPGSSGSFEVYTTSSCEALENEAYLVSAFISPNEICLTEENDDWTGASISAYGVCLSDSLEFVIRNNGTAPTSSLDFIVIEDEIMGRTDILINPNDSISTKFPASGATYRIIVEQEPAHPGKSNPTAVIEGCVADGGNNFTTGYVTMFAEDEANPFVATDAQEGRLAFNGIDLWAYPKGFITDTIAATQEIKYHIVFENTTDEIAERVVVRDTLSNLLSVESIQAGASSHAYDFRMYEDGIIKFVFDSIHLEPGALGFVEFKVAQNLDIIECGDVILNRALINLGYEAPYLTQTAALTSCGDLSYDFGTTVNVSGPALIPGAEVRIFPNPFSGTSTIEITGVPFKEAKVAIYTTNGQLVQQIQGFGPKVELDGSLLKSGIYLIEIKIDDQLVKTGKVFVKK